MAVQTRPTRQGWIVMACAVATGLLGRVFGVLELFILAAALITAFVAAYFVVLLRRPRVSVRRWVRPEVLTAGDVGRVDLVVRPAGPGLRPSFELIEAVGPDRTARMAVSPMRSGRQKQCRVPDPDRTARRADHRSTRRRSLRPSRSGPLRRRRRRRQRDPRRARGRSNFRCPNSATASSAATSSCSRCVSGQASSTACASTFPETSRGRSIGGRQPAPTISRCANTPLRGSAAARSCSTSRCRPGRAHDEAFERAVVAAASLVHSADQHGLQTRFATTAGVDLRGPTVSVHTMHHLARVMPDPHPPRPIERDPGEGLGLVFVITPSPAVGRPGERCRRCVTHR